MATQKQIKLINLIVANLGKQGSGKSMKELMKAAGYSDAQSKNPHQILSSEVIQDGIADFVKMLDDKRRMAITQITESKLEQASARDNAYIADILTKNHQLLTGEETERQGLSINVINYADDNDTLQLPASELPA